MKKVFYLFGILMIGNSIYIHIILRNSFGAQSNPNTAFTQNMLLYGLCGLILLIGLILFIAAVRLTLKDKKSAKMAVQILQTGIPTIAEVTFVDKNYSIRMNGRPIYSIVEFIYTDKTGKEHTFMNRRFDSEMVIRKQITPGKKINIKYDSIDHSQCVVL